MIWLGSVAVHSLTAKLVEIDTTKICRVFSTTKMTATITAKTTRTITELLSKVKTINIFFVTLYEERRFKFSHLRLYNCNIKIYVLFSSIRYTILLHPAAYYSTQHISNWMLFIIAGFLHHASYQSLLINCDFTEFCWLSTLYIHCTKYGVNETMMHIYQCLS